MSILLFAIFFLYKENVCWIDNFLGGHFAPVSSGHIEPAKGGQFKPAQPGQFHRILHVGTKLHKSFDNPQGRYLIWNPEGMPLAQIKTYHSPKQIFGELSK